MFRRSSLSLIAKCVLPSWSPYQHIKRQQADDSYFIPWSDATVGISGGCFNAQKVLSPPLAQREWSIFYFKFARALDAGVELGQKRLAVWWIYELLYELSTRSSLQLQMKFIRRSLTYALLMGGARNVVQSLRPPLIHPGRIAGSPFSTDCFLPRSLPSTWHVVRKDQDLSTMLGIMHPLHRRRVCLGIQKLKDAEAEEVSSLAIPGMER